ncbi:MAG: alpha/beta hydrolase [Desulfobacteraceae bacterium]|nr:alpha/beta hydrolase [Desulfobacteraceae bacterium]
MKHQEGYLKSNKADNIYYQCWLPEDEPRAIFLVVHGLAEHSGRYMNLVNHFVPKGFAVYGIDHIGHGKSDGQRVYVEQFQDFIKTLKIYFDHIKTLQPEKPIFLIGHSMGGLIAAAYLLEYQDELSGAVLSGPGIKKPEHLSSATILAGKMLSILMPKTGISQLKADGISRDLSVVEAYVNDPLVYNGKITARLATQLLKAIDHVTQNGAKIRLPILIAQGSADTIVDPGGAQFLYDLVSSEDKTINIYDGFYHEIFNEPEHDRVLNDVKLWIEKHLEKND